MRDETLVRSQSLFIALVFVLAVRHCVKLSISHSVFRKKLGLCQEQRNETRNRIKINFRLTFARILFSSDHTETTQVFLFHFISKLMLNEANRSTVVKLVHRFYRLSKKSLVCNFV